MTAHRVISRVIILEWVFSISIPPYVIVRFLLPPPTKSMIWRDVAIRPLNKKYVFESKYMHIYFNWIVYWILLKPLSIPRLSYIKRVSKEIPAKKLCGYICYQGIWKGRINIYTWIICLWRPYRWSHVCGQMLKV